MPHELPSDEELDKQIEEDKRKVAEKLGSWLIELNKLPKDQRLLVTTEDDPELVGIEEEMTASELIDAIDFVLGHDSPERREAKSMGNKGNNPEHFSIVKWEIKS